MQAENVQAVEAILAGAAATFEVYGYVHNKAPGCGWLEIRTDSAGVLRMKWFAESIASLEVGAYVVAVGELRGTGSRSVVLRALSVTPTKGLRLRLVQSSPSPLIASGSAP